MANPINESQRTSIRSAGLLSLLMGLGAPFGLLVIGHFHPRTL